MITSERMIVTPKMAEEWLTANIDNRKISQQHIDELARQMTAGHWIENGATIVFTKDGRLIDGQHRLWAGFQAQVPFVTLVVRGAAPQAQDTIDLGAKRTTGQSLSIGANKIENAHRASAIIRACFSLAHHNSALAVSTAEARRFYTEHPAVAAVSKYLHGLPRGLPAQWIGAIYVIGKDYLHNRHSKRFVDVFVNGEPAYPNDPVMRARDAFVLSHSSPNRKLTIGAKLSILTRAWNLHVEDASVQQLRPTDDYGIQGFDLAKFLAWQKPEAAPPVAK